MTVVLKLHQHFPQIELCVTASAARYDTIPLLNAFLQHLLPDTLTSAIHGPLNDFCYLARTLSSSTPKKAAFSVNNLFPHYAVSSPL